MLQKKSAPLAQRIQTYPKVVRTYPSAPKSCVPKRIQTCPSYRVGVELPFGFLWLDRVESVYSFDASFAVPWFSCEHDDVRVSVQSVLLRILTSLEQLYPLMLRLHDFPECHTVG